MDASILWSSCKEGFEHLGCSTSPLKRKQRGIQNYPNFLFNAQPRQKSSPPSILWDAAFHLQLDGYTLLFYCVWCVFVPDHGGSGERAAGQTAQAAPPGQHPTGCPPHLCLRTLAAATRMAPGGCPGRFSKIWATGVTEECGEGRSWQRCRGRSGRSSNALCVNHSWVDFFPSVWEIFVPLNLSFPLSLVWK